MNNPVHNVLSACTWWAIQANCRHRHQNTHFKLFSYFFSAIPTNLSTGDVLKNSFRFAIDANFDFFSIISTIKVTSKIPCFPTAAAILLSHRISSWYQRSLRDCFIFCCFRFFFWKITSMRIITIYFFLLATNRLYVILKSSTAFCEPDEIYFFCNEMFNCCFKENRFHFRSTFALILLHSIPSDFHFRFRIEKTQKIVWYY